jgi:hypothetical protein
MPDFLPAMPHGPLIEVFPDVFFVTGGFRVAPGLTITRNMTVVREGQDLVIVNSVRLSPEGEAELEKLGKVRHVVRMGAFHGADDPYFVHRFAAELWAPPGTDHAAGLKSDHELRPGSSPVSGSQVFLFEKGKLPEAALILERDGGLLLTCDSYQNWTHFDGCSLLGKLMMKALGFGPTLVGGLWTKRMGREVRADFERLKTQPFSTLLPAHGTILRDRAKQGLDVAVKSRFDG